ncbi:TetR/AcrR family transcriptional regulator [Cupriavidus basilensis]|uniref:TetR/AcrR family transcriptional regulator n=1 Tax=Cupriavidus basilensis TaxID=68895 RepID=UPI0039F6A9C7
MENQPQAPSQKPVKSRRTQHERREEATRRILESAIELICEKGMAGVTMREIGARSGYSRALTAHHYGDKEGLLVALVDQIGVNIRKARLANSHAKPGLETVLEIVRFTLGRDPAHLKVLQAFNVILSEGRSPGGPVALALERMTRESAAHIEAELRIGIEEGEIRSDLDPAEEAMAIVGTIRGISAQFLFGASHVNAEGVRQSIVSILERGLASLPTRSVRSRPIRR